MLNEQQVAYILYMQEKITELAQVCDKASDIAKVYFDRGYGTSGGQEIVDNDLTDYGFSAVDLANCITTLEQLNNFVSGAAITQADWKAKINKIRNDM
jgi:hypothetical protein